MNYVIVLKMGQWLCGMSPDNLAIFTCKIPSNLLYKAHQIPKLNCFPFRLAAVFALSIEARCFVENEDVVGAAPTGDAPTTSE